MLEHPIKQEADGLYEQAILKSLDALEDGQSLDPNNVAKSIDPDNWRRLLSQIRNAAIGMARKGHIDILRKGKPLGEDVSHQSLKGLYRLRKKIVPKQDDV